MTDVVVQARIDAPPEVVYDLISDVTQMSRWSPETTSCRWLDGADCAHVGARFRGTNRMGWRRWSTTCTVTAAEPGRRFAFDVAYGPFPISAWSYELIGDGGDTIVREAWRERRPPWLRALTGRVMAVTDRVTHNRSGMEATLEALRAVAEPQAGRGT
jgi:uncharacterized protein YndB with AHSA1/START domain